MIEIDSQKTTKIMHAHFNILHNDGIRPQILLRFIAIKPTSLIVHLSVTLNEYREGREKITGNYWNS